jgi:DNA-binding GntR family transcriptional regulator
MTEPRTLEDLAFDARRAYQTVEDMVHHVVREGILGGIYKPGERLPQDRIAEIMGVSRIPVRAALRRLEAEGFVDFVAHKGATVRSLSPKEIAEIYDLRALLETYALRAAASQVTKEELDEFEQLAQRLDGTTDPDEWVEVRQQFYERLYEIADRPRTTELIAKLRADVGRYWLMQRVTEGHEGQSHTVIVEALRDGSPIAAEEWLQDHLTDVSKELQRRVAEAPDPG